MELKDSLVAPSCGGDGLRGLPARGRLPFPAGRPVCRCPIGLGCRFHLYTPLNGFGTEPASQGADKAELFPGVLAPRQL